MTEAQKDAAAIDAGIAALQRVTVLEAENADLVGTVKDLLDHIKECCTNAVGNFPSDVRESIERAETVIEKSRDA